MFGKDNNWKRSPVWLKYTPRSCTSWNRINGEKRQVLKNI